MVRIKTNKSEVVIGNEVFAELTNCIEELNPSKIFILVDENTLEHCAAELITNVPFLQDAELIEINSGEENKTLDICYQIWKTLAEYKADRKSLLINLGGGVITDMGGFIASTFKRGIEFINMPTTLLSQIDASVGGKVGVDFEALKNMIGVFNEPLKVLVYPEFLKTLDKRQMLSGYAEALKHSLICDPKYWNKLKSGLLSDANNWMSLIVRSVEIKNEIVLEDPFEKNVRKKLNFGHTIGHAIESFALDNEKIIMLHGEAIAIGMICESYIAYKNNFISVEELEEISHAILSFYTLPNIENNWVEKVMDLMQNDKKNETDEINFTLISGIGKAEINETSRVDIIKDSFSYYNSLLS